MAVGSTPRPRPSGLLNAASVYSKKYENEIREAGCITIAGGPYPSACYNKVAQYADYVVVGEGEHSGVVSGLRLKGVTNERAGKFANRVDPDGIIRINHPKPEGHVEKKENPFHVLK